MNRTEPVSKALLFLAILGLPIASCGLPGTKIAVGIDPSGKELFRREVPATEVFGFSHGFSEGLALIGTDDHYGYIDRAGNLVVPKQLHTAYDFSEGLAAVIPKSEAGYGYLDKNGKMIIHPRFSWARRFSEGLAYVQNKDAPYQCGFIDKTGKMVIKIGATEPQLAGDFAEALAPAIDADNKQWGFIDHTGKFVIKPIYDWADHFGDGLAMVRVDEKCGFIDHHGNSVVPPKYDDARGFVDGMAAVKRDDLWGYIDTKGGEVIPLQYRESSDFSQGMATVEKGSVVDITQMLINKSGKIVVNDAQFSSFSPPSQGLVAVARDGGWGYMNIAGKMVIDPIYSSGSSFHENIAIVVAPKKN